MDVPPLNHEDVPYEEAISLIGNGKFHFALNFITGLCLMFSIMEVTSTAFYAETARCDMAFSLSEQGLLASAPYLGVVIGSYPLGYLADRLGRLKIIRISILGAVFASLISAFSYSIFMLTSFRLIVGIFIAGIQVTVFSYLGEFYGSKTKSKPVAALTIYITAGLVFIPILAIGVLPLELDGQIYGKPFSSWRLFAILISASNFLLSIILHFFPESPKFLLSIGKKKEAIHILRFIYSINNGQCAEKFPVSSIKLDEINTKSFSNGFIERIREIIYYNREIFKKERILTTLNLVYQLLVTYLVTHGLIIWIPTILTWMSQYTGENFSMAKITQSQIHQGNISIIKTNCEPSTNVYTLEILMFLGLFCTITYTVQTFIVNKFDERLILGIWQFMTGAAGVALYWAHGFYICIALLIILIASGNGGGIICMIAVNYYPTQTNSLAICLMMLIARFGVVIGSNIYRILLITNPNILFLGLGCSMISLTVLSAFLPKNIDKLVAEK